MNPTDTHRNHLRYKFIIKKGDKVYFIYNNEIVRGIIDGGSSSMYLIKLTISKKTIHYVELDKSLVFKVKRDLILYLVKTSKDYTTPDN